MADAGPGTVSRSPRLRLLTFSWGGCQGSSRACQGPCCVPVSGLWPTRSVSGCGVRGANTLGVKVSTLLMWGENASPARVMKPQAGARAAPGSVVRELNSDLLASSRGWGCTAGSGQSGEAPGARTASRACVCGCEGEGQAPLPGDSLSGGGALLSQGSVPPRVHTRTSRQACVWDTHTRMPTEKQLAPPETDSASPMPTVGGVDAGPGTAVVMTVGGEVAPP